MEIRTLKETSILIENAIIEIKELIKTRRKKYEDDKFKAGFDIENEKDKLNKRWNKKIDADKEILSKTPDGREKLSQLRLDHQEALKEYKERGVIKMRAIKRGYLKDCNLIITNVSYQLNLNRKHLKRILGANYYFD